MEQFLKNKEKQVDLMKNRWKNHLQYGMLKAEKESRERSFDRGGEASENRMRCFLAADTREELVC